MSRSKKSNTAPPTTHTLMAPTEMWKQMSTRAAPWRPSPWQTEFLGVVKTPWPGLMEDGQPYPSIFAGNIGRQGGKTELGPALIWQGLLAADDDVGPPQVRLTADTEEHAQKIWDRFIYTVENSKLGQTFVKSHSKERHLVTLHTGATAQFLSGQNPQALSGDSVTLWIIDEAQFFSQAAYTNLLPSILARNGVIVMLGVAQGNGPYKEVSWRGELENRAQFPRYLTLRYSSYDNPFVKKEAVDLMAETLTPEDYANLILAQWGQGIGKVFGDVRSLVSPGWKINLHPQGFYYTQLPLPGNVYYGGLDIARFRDWTVYTLFNSRGELVAWDRYHRMSFESQYERITRLHNLYGNALTAVDQTSIGIAPVEALKKRGMVLRPKMIASNQEKRRLVDQVALRVGDRGYRFPQWDQLVNEMERYEATEITSPSGNTYVRYSAPSGFYDDVVMSIALATDVLPRVHRTESRSSMTPPRQAGIWESLGEAA
jgi:hypothetical protein